MLRTAQPIRSAIGSSAPNLKPNVPDTIERTVAA